MIEIPEAPYDEVGTPDEFINHCEKHDVLYRTGGKCLRCEEEPA